MPREQIPAANEPTMYNKTLVTTGVEEEQVINTYAPFGEPIKGIQIKSKTSNSLQYGFVSGGPYTTIPSDQTYAMWNLAIHQDFSLFLVGSIDGQVAEIEVWR